MSELQSSAQELRENGVFYLALSYTKSKPFVCVAVHGNANELSLVEMDSECVRAAHPQDQKLLQFVLEEHWSSLLQVQRVAFEPRACCLCGSKTHRVTDRGETVQCAEEWACIMRRGQ